MKLGIPKIGRFAALFLLFVMVSSAWAKPKLVEGTMSRSLLDEVVAQGPQRLIATLQVEPHMVKGRFIGYRIVGLSADSPLLNSRSVLPGDVIMSVNREPIERPEQFMRAWEVVQNAKRLQVTLMRGSEHLRYRWKLLP
jgi:S1-C subfamily serine protease